MQYLFTFLAFSIVNLLSAKPVDLPPFQTIISGPHVELELINGLIPFDIKIAAYIPINLLPFFVIKPRRS